MTRRQLLAAALAAGAWPAWAAAPDFAIDWQGAAPDPAVLARLQRQVAAVRALPIRADILAFFAAVPIRVATDVAGESHTPGVKARGVVITRRPFPDDNPVLLHELIHRWHFDTLANTPRAAPLRALFAAERAAPHWPADAYMYKNISEFLAMSASVVLSGRAARPPSTRAEVAQRAPALYDWIVATFGLRLP